ncbi:MAG: PIN domain-containing protein [Acidobacteriota bacterium]|nr:PIN domain-containing protein [Acidobacteriota bacterium]
MIVLDTSALVDSLSGPQRSAPRLREAIAAGHRIALPTLVFYEWLRGPRLDEELEAQEALLPAAGALDFGTEEARIAASLFRSVPHPRGRSVDIAIAATAIAHAAHLWTLNYDDFIDLPGLALYSR